MKIMGGPHLPRGALPRQIKRALPIYIVIALIVFLATNADRLRSSSIHHSTVKRDIAYKPATSIDEIIPKKIWQTWKVDALSFEERDLTIARTWTTRNSGHRYEALTDNNDMYYVETHFGPAGLNRPDIVETYRSLTAKIIKADLIRYLVMYIEGGVYTDIDVEALKPIDRFIPDRYDQSKISMVIGIEIDQPEFRDHAILGKKSMSFCQWTFMAKPRLPVMLRLIDGILVWLNDLSKQKEVPIGELQLDFDEVIIGTGPSAFTAAVLAEMSIETGETVEWDQFHAMPESKLVGGVLVLTVEAFAAGQGHSDSGNHNARTALVKHHYHASGWPKTHPRFTHPVYGEVERCNWEVECVKLWDFNKAAFDSLSPEDQQKQIVYKEATDAQAARQAEEIKALKAIQEENLAKYVAAEKVASAEIAARLAAQPENEANLVKFVAAEKALAEQAAKGASENDLPSSQSEEEVNLAKFVAQQAALSEQGANDAKDESTDREMDSSDGRPSAEEPPAAGQQPMLELGAM